jgi:hypothetical protein
VRTTLLPICLLWNLLAAPGLAQCSTFWRPGSGVPCTNGSVYATTTWDPDGTGPLPRVLVVGGSFSIAGTAGANCIATFEPISGGWFARDPRRAAART